MLQHFRTVAVTCTTFTTALVAGPVVAQDNGPVKIGFTGALTGPYNEYGEGLRRGITLAVEEWNKRGGVNGRKVEFPEPLDDQLVPDRAVQNTRRILDDKSVQLIVSPSGSGPTLAVVDMVMADAGRSAMRRPRHPPLSIRTVATSRRARISSLSRSQTPSRRRSSVRYLVVSSSRSASYTKALAMA